MTIKLFCKQIEVVDYERFSLYRLLLLHWCICLSCTFEFFKRRKYYTAIIQYIHYILFCCISINNYTIISI